jgi:hypothetical protein
VHDSHVLLSCNYYSTQINNSIMEFLSILMGTIGSIVDDILDGI